MSTVTTYLNLVKPASPEQFSLATYNNNLDLVDTHLKDVVQKLAKGRLLRNAGSDTGSVAARTVMASIATFSFKGGRKYRIKWYGNAVIGGADNSYFTFTIGTAAVSDAAGLTTGITEYAALSQRHHQNGLTEKFDAEAWFEPAIDTTLQIKFLITRGAGTGTLALTSSLQAPLMEIHDEGAQY